MAILKKPTAASKDAETMADDGGEKKSARKYPNREEGTKLSSCSVERVFSKLKDIRDAVGDRMLEDISEIRLLLQCNGDLDDYCDIFEGRKE
eukprot:scaffold14588_cov110-Skeletonema_marinoi.AAC.1